MPLSRLTGIIGRVVIAASACAGIWRCLELMRADVLFRSWNEAALQQAIRIAPDAWPYYVRLSELEPGDAPRLLEAAQRLNPHNADVAMELGMLYEAQGDSALAKQYLLAASRVDRSYRPRWALAYFDLRHGDISGYWRWAGKAADVPADDLGPLYDLCWGVDPDPEQIALVALKGKPELLRPFIAFLLTKDQLDAAGLVARHLLKTGDPIPDTPLLLSVVNRLMAADEPSSADKLWQSLIKSEWVVADATVPNNGDFEREPLSVSFDWRLPQGPGFHSWTSASGLRTQFTGSVPTDCSIAEQIVSLVPGDYSMSSEYHTSQIAKDSGLHWQIIDLASNKVLATSSDLSSETLGRMDFDFSVPPDTSFVRIRLAYQQVPKRPSISGVSVILSTRIQPKSATDAESGAAGMAL